MTSTRTVPRPDRSPWGPIRYTLIVIGALAWPAGATLFIVFLFLPTDLIPELTLLAPWFASAGGLLLAAGTLLSARVRNDAPGWTLRTGVPAVFRRHPVGATAVFVLWVSLFVSVPLAVVWNFTAALF